MNTFLRDLACSQLSLTLKLRTFESVLKDAECVHYNYIVVVLTSRVVNTMLSYLDTFSIPPLDVFMLGLSYFYLNF